MDKKEFEKFVVEAVEMIPEKIMKMAENVQICVEDEPTEKQINSLKMKKRDILFGLYEGIPKTKRGNYGFSLPDKITIFKNSIEKVAFSREEIREKVKKTIWHEIAHHFGIDEDRVRNLERKRFHKTN